MGHSSKSKRQKGCGLCRPNKFHDGGQSARQPPATLRKVGKERCVSRHDLGDQDLTVDASHD
jgi:hypothetical protein